MRGTGWIVPGMALVMVLVTTIGKVWAGDGTSITMNTQFLDGDTLRTSPISRKYRLFGIDAPELSEPGGQEAKQELIKIIGEDGITCHPTGAVSHDRLVAVCSTPTYPDIGAELIRRGYALDCRRFSHGKYRSLEPSWARERIKQKPYCR